MFHLCPMRATSLRSWQVGRPEPHQCQEACAVSRMESMKTSESILEVLEQNARWWEKAAAHCESITPHMDPNKKDGEDIAPVIPREREHLEV